MSQPIATREEPRPAERESGALRAVALVGAGLIPVAAVFAGYFLFYVTAKQAYLRERNFRALSTLTRQFTERLDGLRVAAESAPPRDHDAKRAPQKRGLETIDASQGTYSARPDELFIQWSSAGGAQQAPKDLTARLQFRAILDARLTQNIFDDVLIADPSGRVLYQHRSFETGKVTDLSTLRHGAQRISPCEPLGVEPQGAGAKVQSSTTGGDKSLAEAVDSGNCFVLQHQGHTQLAFFQSAPLPFSVRATDKLGGPSVSWNDQDRWIFCGLVSQDRFTGHAREISPTLIALLIFAVLTAVMAWPLLKLWSLGPQERLSAADVSLLGVSVIGVIGLLTAFVLDVQAYSGLRLRLDGQMRDLGKRIEQDFLAEVEQVYPLMDRLRRGLEDSPAEVGSRVTSLKLAYPYFTDLLWIDKNGSTQHRWEPKATDEGWQVVEGKRPETDLSDRGYFSAAQDGNLWTMACRGDRRGRSSEVSVATAADGHGCRDGDGEMRFAAEVVQSKLTGAFNVVLARSPQQGGTEKPVAVIASSFRSVIDPVMPPWIDFAIIDRLGRVQLHSEKGRNLREDLFQECDNDRDLRAAVENRQERHLDGTYYGQDYRLYTMPLRDTAWSIVVLRKSEPLRSLNTWITTAWLVMFGGYLLGYVLIAILVQLVWPRYRAEWLWPRREQGATYQVAAAVLVIVALITLVTGAHRSTAAEITSLIALPLAAITSLHLLLRRDPNRAPRTLYVAIVAAAVTTAATLILQGYERSSLATAGFLPVAVMILIGSRSRRRRSRELAFRLNYVAMLFALLLVLSVVPAALLFNSAYESGLTALVRLGQRLLLSDINDHTIRMRKLGVSSRMEGSVSVDHELGRYSLALFDSSAADGAPAFDRAPLAQGPNESSPPTREGMGAWMGVAWGQTGASIWTRSPARARGQSHVAALLSYVLPAFSMNAARVGGMVQASASDQSWTSRFEDGRRRLTLSLRDPRLADDEASELHAVVPPLIDPQGVPWWLGAVLLIGGGVLLIVSILSRLVRDVFMLEADVRPIDVRPVLSDRLCLFVRPAAQPLRGTHAFVIDVAALDRSTDCDRRLQLCASTAAGTVVIDNFSGRLDSPEWCEALQRMLTQLMSWPDVAIVVLSAVDPLAYWGTVTPEAKRPDLTQWAAVLGQFQTHWISVAEPTDGLLGATLGACIAAKRHGASAEAWWQPHYREIWARLGQPERLVLTQLAGEGFANPKGGSLVQRLMTDGIIARDPGLSIVPPELHRFVMAAETPETVARWERQRGWSNWATLRPVLLAFLGLGAFFFYMTQRGLFDSTVATVIAVGGALPAVLRLFSNFSRDGTQGA